MRNLHPELISSVQARTLYSKSEEDLLGTIKSVSIKRFLKNIILTRKKNLKRASLPKEVSITLLTIINHKFNFCF